jgi:hypothetical protein
VVENGLNPLFRSPAVNSHVAKGVSLRADRWLPLIVLLVCAVGLAGCASFFKFGKDKPVEARPNETGLIHPTIPAEKIKESEATPSKDAGEKKQDGQEPGSRITVAAAAGTQSKTVPDKKDSPPLLSRAESQTTGTNPPDKSFDEPPKDSEPPAAKKQETSDASGKTPEESDTLFKKHDHLKYTRLIHNAAIDIVNKAETAVYARLCKDSTTDDWSLTLYYLHGRTYSFVTYAWDEVDQKWVEAFVSDKRPVSRYQKHLDFSSAGKECKVLKERKIGDLPKTPR